MIAVSVGHARFQLLQFYRPQIEVNNYIQGKCYL